MSSLRKRIPKEAAQSLVAVFSEAEFVPLLKKRLAPLIDLCHEVRPERNCAAISKAMVSAIEDQAHDVETFLDDYDARSNKTFATITEYIACARGFAEIDRTIQHVMLRFSSYHAARASSFDDEFLSEASRTLVFADTSLRALLAATAREASRVVGGLAARRQRARAEPVERAPRFHLPHDIDELAAMNERDKIAELASTYLTHKHTLDQLSECKRIGDVADLRRYILDVSDEEQCRFFQTKIHNLQSKYDTFIKATEAEQSDPDLRRFRGYISISLHLIECMTQLVHFYERHENDVREEQVKNRIAALIDKDVVLDRAVNFCLYYTHVYLNEGAPLAERLVARYTSQEKLVVELPDGVNIHIRPASLIAEVVKYHATPVKITIGNDTRYAGSPLDILMAAGANSAERTITFAGDRRPLQDLKRLFEHRLGEDGLTRLPRQLSYLRRKKRAGSP